MVNSFQSYSSEQARNFVSANANSILTTHRESIFKGKCLRFAEIDYRKQHLHDKLRLSRKTRMVTHRGQYCRSLAFGKISLGCQ